MNVSASPLVSVIIPSYNRPDEVPRAVRNALNQSYQNIEVIVVDDGSRLPVREVLEGCEDPRLRVVRQENKGVSAARNLGVRVARGDVLAFHDDDDFWAPVKVERQIAQMREEKTEASIAKFFWKMPNGVLHPSRLNFWKGVPRWALIAGVGMGAGTGLVVLKDAFEKVGGFKEELGYGEDWHWLVCARDLRFSLSKEPLFIYNGSHSASWKPNQVNLLDAHKAVISSRDAKILASAEAFEKAIRSTRSREFGAAAVGFANSFAANPEVFFGLAEYKAMNKIRRLTPSRSAVTKDKLLHFQL